jgi:tRNA A58 N-methylase Trm61
MKPQTVVEVGVYKGFTASWLARALQENGSGHLYGIDNFSLTDHETRLGTDARSHLRHNLESLGVDNVVTILDGDSDKVNWPEKVDFAYIDGWHSYLAAKYDFLQCAKRGAECVCFDDAVQSVGPRMLIQEIRDSGDWDVLTVDRDCGMAICMRKKKLRDITFSQELPNHPGVDLQALTREEQMEHLDDCSKINAVSYQRIRGALCSGK